MVCSFQLEEKLPVVRDKLTMWSRASSMTGAMAFNVVSSNPSLGSPLPAFIRETKLRSLVLSIGLKENLGGGVSLRESQARTLSAGGRDGVVGALLLSSLILDWCSLANSSAILVGLFSLMLSITTEDGLVAVG